MRRLVCCLALLVAASVARAGTELPIPLRSDGEAKISVGSCFDFLPPAGYAPIAVKIDNQGSTAQAWMFNFMSPGFGYGADTMHFSATLRVQANAAREFKLIVPLSVHANAYFNPLGVNVSGPGADDQSAVQFSAMPNRSGKPFTVFVGMSETLALRFSNELGEEIKNDNHQLALAKFRATELPEDWRALVGFAGLWLTGEEVAQLSPAQRGALHDWMCQGGSLYLCSVQQPIEDLRATGLGRLVVLPSEELAIGATAKTIRALEPSLPQHLAAGYAALSERWAARDIVGEIKMNLPLLIGFLAVFAILVGPLNLFVFAPTGRRHRLFWTTPAISVGASLALFLIIIFQDGFGGSGVRTALVYLQPIGRKQVTLQEQLARTGVITSSTFATAEPSFIGQIKLDLARNAPSRRYANSDRTFSGGWFASRSLQAHWVESISSTRAEVALVNAAELRDPNVAPVILSSISAPLGHLVYHDEHGRFWQTAMVRMGERTTLESVQKPPQLLPKQAGPRLRAAWENVRDLPGHFYATSESGNGMIDTLPSIRWHDQQVIYCGPVSGAEEQAQ